MRKNRIKLFILLFWVFFSCRENKYTPYQKIIDQTDFKKNKYKKILVIPNEGCSGCISSATDYAVNNISKTDSIFIVFTNIHDIKKLKLSLRSFLSYKFVRLDTINHFSSSKIKSIYPQYWHIKNGKIIKIQNYN